MRVESELCVTSTIFAIQLPIIGNPPAADNTHTKTTDTKANPSVTPIDQKNPFTNPSLIKSLNLVNMIHCSGTRDNVAT